MSMLTKATAKLNWLSDSISFFRNHFAVVLALGLIAAFGRVVQLGGFGDIGSTVNFIVELVVESARIFLVLYVLGIASIKNGALRLIRLFRDKENRKSNTRVAVNNFRKQWVAILLNFAGFLVIAWAFNYLIKLLAYETCLYLTLKKDGILAESSSEWTILLFFKNLSVIPFTLVFETVFLLYITNKLEQSRNVKFN